MLNFFPWSGPNDYNFRYESKLSLCTFLYPGWAVWCFVSLTHCWNIMKNISKRTYFSRFYLHEVWNLWLRWCYTPFCTVQFRHWTWFSDSQIKARPSTGGIFIIYPYSHVATIVLPTVVENPGQVARVLTPALTLCAMAAKPAHQRRQTPQKETPQRSYSQGQTGRQSVGVFI